jgi:hypothetical protein
MTYSDFLEGFMPDDISHDAVVPADDAPAVFDRVRQQVEDLGLDRHQSGAAAQLTPLLVASPSTE